MIRQKEIIKIFEVLNFKEYSKTECLTDTLTLVLRYIKE